MKLPDGLKHTIEVIGLVTALAVDIIVIPICMITIAPDALTKAAFVCIGVTIVFSVFLSWAKGNRVAWLIFAAVVFFFDLSFALVATNEQSHKIDAAQDAEIVLLDLEIRRAQTQISLLREERTISTRPETIASISDDIRTEEANIEAFREDRKIRESEFRKTGGVKITADAVFSAIPDAVAEKRYIPLVVFALIFLSLQAVVVTSIDAPKREKRDAREVKETPAKPAVPEAPKPQAPVRPARQESPLDSMLGNAERAIDLDTWIRFVWRTEKFKKMEVPKDEHMIEYCRIAGIAWDKAAHEKNIARARELRVIVGNTLAVTQSEAEKKMKNS